MAPNHKIKLDDELLHIVHGFRQAGKRIVWTNGCFDILHRGHVAYLERAKTLGDVLVVGVNSDCSVRAIKGPDRPVNSQSRRAESVAALDCVNYVVVFDDLTTVRLLELLKPDVYAKGGDYTVHTINQEERHLVEGYGGSIVILPKVTGVSTTAIIEQRRHGP